MSRQLRMKIRVAVAGLFLLSGVSHSLYYVLGLMGSWEKDLWNLMQVAAGLGVAFLGWWIWRWRHRSFKGKSLMVLRFFQVGIGLGLALFVAAEFWIWSGGRSTEAKQTDYLLILGARVRGDTLSLSLKARLDQGLDYLQQYPDTKIILSGGQGPGENLTEAAAMKQYLVKQGVPASRILEENRSTSTYENLAFSRDLLKDQGVDPSGVTLTLITNDFHMLRSKLLADRVGLQVYGYPAETPPYTVPRMLTREFAAMVKSFVIDR